MINNINCSGTTNSGFIIKWKFNDVDNEVNVRDFEVRNSIINKLIDAQINHNKPHITNTTRIKYVKDGR